MVWRPKGGSAVILSLLMLLSMAAPAGAAVGGTDAASNSAPTPAQDDVENDTSPTAGPSSGTIGADDPERSSTRSGGGGPPVDPALENASGPTEVIVRFEEARETPGASASSASALQNHAQQTQQSFERYARTTDAVDIEQSFWITNAMLVQMNASEVPPGQLVQFDGVQRVHRNFEVEALSAEGENATSPWSLGGGSSSTGDDVLANDDSAPNGTWGVEAVNAPETWEAFDTRGGGVNVTVLDTGVNASHPDINLSAWAEIDRNGAVAETGVANATDPQGHGTHVSGTVAGGNASGEYIGVAPNASLKHGLVLPGGEGTFSQIIGGMEWATNDTDSDVISMSLGIADNGYHSEFIDPVQNARSNGILMVVATGNEGEWTSRSPGNIYDSFSIGAVDSNLSVAGFSSGEWIDTSEAWDGEAPDSWPERYTVPDVVAPGVNVKSADNATTGYRSINGTSMAAPHVAGVAALVLAANGSLNDTNVEQTISETASEPHTYEEPDHRYGTGFVDALNATASVSRNATVSGWVTNATTGAAIANARVETEYGLRTRTNATGYYEFEVPSTNQTITADPLGFEANGTAVNATGQASAQQNITVSTEIVEARLVEAQDRYTNSSAGLNVSYRVANVGNYNMSLLYDDTFSIPSGATLSVDGTNQPRNSNITINADSPTTINVSLDPGDGYFGGLVLDHTFYAQDGSTNVTDTTGLSRVHDDPVDIPGDLDPSSLQKPIDYVEKNTTIALDDTTYSETIDTSLGGNTRTALVLRNRVSLAAAANADPTVTFTGGSSDTLDTGIVVTGHDTELSGVTFDGGGEANALVLAQTLGLSVPTGLEVRNAEFRDAGDAVVLSIGTADAIENNTFTNVLSSVYANGGDVRSFANNTGTGITGEGILLETSLTNATTIADNDLTIDASGTVGIRTDQLTDISAITGNEITLNNDSANGIVTHRSPQSVAPVTVANNEISGGNIGIVVRDVGNAVLVEGNNVTNSTIGISDRYSVDSTYRRNTIDGIDEVGLRLIGVPSLPTTNVTVTNNTITDVGQTGDSPAIGLYMASDVSITNTTVSGGGISVYNASGVTTRGNDFSNADAGLVVQANSTDVSSEGPTFTNVTSPAFVARDGGFSPANVTVTNATVTTDLGTVFFGDISAGAADVTNLTLADGTTVNASGRNASLALDTDPSGGSFPADTSGIGRYLNLTAAGPNPAMDVNVSYADGDLSGQREDTLQFYRYNDTAWEPVSSSGVDTSTNDVWASITNFSTFAPLAEEPQANFTVPSIEANASNVLEGDTVQINATVNNTGDGNGTQDVALNVSDGVGEVATTNVSLNASEQTTVALNWTTADAGDYNASIVTADDSNSTAVRVDAPANFSVEAVNASTPVVEGDTMLVNATINNTGDRLDNQTIEMDVEGVQDSTDVELGGGNQTAVQLSWSTSAGDAGTYTANVSSANETTGTQVEVQEPANFSVTIDNTNSPVTEGDELTVDATFNNTGDVSGTQDVDLTIDGGGGEVANQTLELNASENVTQTFTWSTSVGDNGTYTAAVNSENDSATTDVTVQTPANFTVQIDSTNSPVVAGDDLTVNATINNTGETNATQNVTLDVAGSERDSESVTLNGGASTSVSLNWTTGSGDAGNYTANVSSANDTASSDVEVQEPANYTVSIDNTNTPVLVNETLSVDATINNTGDVDGSQTVNLSIDDSIGEVDSEQVDLNGSTETTITLEWTNTTAAGDYNATVAATTDSDSRPVRVDEPANFSVAIDDTSSPVTEGSTLDVNATITNVGDRNATQDVTLDLDGGVGEQANVSISLNASESSSRTVQWTTADGDTGDYNATVSSANDSATEGVTVQEPANFSVTLDETNEPVTEGENLTVDATFENIGDVSGTQDVNLTINHGVDEVENTTVELDPDNTTAETFQWATTEGDAGEYTATVNSVNDSATADVTVQTPANYSVNVTGSDSSVAQNETLSVDATINNTGESAGNQTISLRANGTQQNQTTVELEGGNETEVTLQWDTTDVSPGTYTANVTSQDDNDTAEVEVLEQANFSIVDVSANDSVLVNETVQVNATINNTGGVEATQNVSLDVDGDVGTVDHANVTIGPGNESTVTLDWTDTSTSGDYNATVNTEDDSNTTTVSVDAPAYFAVENVNSSSPVVEGDTLVANATINNTGDRSDNQTVELNVSGVTNTTDIELDGGNQTSVQLFWTTTADDAGNYTANVSSANETADTSVHVQAPANFSVTTIDSNDPVANDTVSVTATIENVGDVEDEQNVTLNVSNGSGVVDDQNVSLDGGDTETLTLNWSDTSPGDYNATIETADDANTTSVRVDAPANFSVSIDSTNSNVTEGETLEVNATIENVGDVEDTQTINLTVDDAWKDSADVTLPGGQNQSVTLTWNTTFHDNGTYTANVSSDDTYDTEEVTVENASVYFQVTEFDAPDTATAGESFSVTATVTNYGVDNGTQNVTYWFDNAQVALEENVSIDSGNSTDVTFTHSEGTAGEYPHFVQTENDANNTKIEIQSSGGGGGGGGYLPPPSDGPSTNFLLSSFVVSPTEVGTGEEVSAEVRVDNDGEDDGEFTGTLTADGEAVAEETVSVNSNWHETVTLSTSFDEPGTYDLAVNGEAAGTVTVVGGANLVIAETGIESSSVRAGETVTLTTTVRNDGDSEGSRTVALVVGDETVDSRTVMLGPGESETVTFEHSFSATGSHEVTVGGESIPNVEVRESQVDDGDGGDGGFGGVLPVLLGVLGVLIAAGSLAVYFYGDEIGELLEG